MTYGENAGAISDELAHLLAFRRVQQRIGGPGNPSNRVFSTSEEREQLSRVIQRSRYAVLVWCAQALRAVSVKDEPRWSRTPVPSPVGELRRRLAHALAPGPGDLRLVEMLAMSHPFELVTRWQSAARSAALGEHDFASDVNRGWLSDAEMTTVRSDVSNVVRAISVLDKRYRLLPGWRQLAGSAAMGLAAETLREATDPHGVQQSVDIRGWRPRPGRLSPANTTGLEAAVIAQHNLVIELGQLPTAMNLRRVFYLQAQASVTAARAARLQSLQLAGRYLERADVYQQLTAQTRNLAGLLGRGEEAVLEAHHVLSALRHVQPAQRCAPEPWEELARLFSAADARLTVTVERGLAERSYFVGVPFHGLSEERIGGVVQPRTRYMPSGAQSGDHLVPLLRQRLNSPAPALPRAAGDVDRRAQLEQSLGLRPASGRAR